MNAKLGSAADCGRGSAERSAHALAERCEPLDGLVGVNEADVAWGDGLTPGGHWRGGDLVLEQRGGEVRRGRARRLGVEQQRPAPVRGDRREPGELLDRHVVAALPLGDAGRVVIGAQRRNRTELVEAACDEPVVDVDHSELGRDRLGRDDPADPPSDHPLFAGDAAQA